MKKILLLFFFMLFTSSNALFSNTTTISSPYFYDNHSSIITYSNKDTIGILTIPGINYEEFLVQTNNNNFYLNHNYNKEMDMYGHVFLDYRTNLNSRQLNVYDHNFLDQPKGFANLLKYQDKDFAFMEPDIFIKTNKDILHFKIFAASFINKDNTEHMRVLFGLSSEFNSHVNNMLSNALYNFNENGIVTQIIVLQTCAYQNGDFFLVFAKRV